jgi:hypothetical protein
MTRREESIAAAKKRIAEINKTNGPGPLGRDMSWPPRKPTVEEKDEGKLERDGDDVYIDDILPRGRA